MRMPHFDEQHRHECEVRWVASLPLRQRREFLAKVEELRGLEARLKLQEGLTQLWKTKNTTQTML